MSRHLREYVVALAQFEHVARQVPPDAWDCASPCAGWSAREVAGHALGAMGNVAAKLGRREPVDAFADVAALAGDDPLATFRAIRDEVLEALDRPGALQTRVHSGLGDMAMDDYLVPMTHDAFVHAWDIARATGADEALDPWLLGVVAERMMQSELPRRPDRYGEVVSTGGDASLQERLLAFTGRHP